MRERAVPGQSIFRHFFTDVSAVVSDRAMLRYFHLIPNLDAVRLWRHERSERGRRKWRGRKALL